MSDLIDRQAVIDTIHRFFTEEVDKIPTKKTEDGEVYIMHKCQPLFEMNKAICKRIKALASASPTQKCVENALSALDCIGRQATLEPYKDLNDDGFISVRLIRKNIEQQPSAIPTVIEDIKAEINEGIESYKNKDKAVMYGFMCALYIIDKHIEGWDKE